MSFERNVCGNNEREMERREQKKDRMNDKMKTKCVFFSWKLCILNHLLVLGMENYMHFALVLSMSKTWMIKLRNEKIESNFSFWNLFAYEHRTKSEKLSIYRTKCISHFSGGVVFVRCDIFLVTHLILQHTSPHLW